MITTDTPDELKERLKCRQTLDDYFYKWIDYFDDGNNRTMKSPFGRAVRYEEHIYKDSASWDEYYYRIEALAQEIERNGIEHMKEEDRQFYYINS